jgi:hypothetical protein
MAIPLATSWNAKTANFWLFGWLFHPIYVMISTQLGFIFTNFFTEIPSIPYQLLVCGINAIIAALLNTLYWHLRVPQMHVRELT